MRTTRPNRIAEQRRAKGLSQQQLADAIGVHWTTISKLERGVTRLDFTWTDKLSQALGVDEWDLLPQVRRVTTISVSGEIHLGGEVDPFDDNKVRTWHLNSNVFEDLDMIWVEVRGNALYPYFKDNDLLGLTWATEEECLNDKGEMDYSGFYGRFCLVSTKEEDQFMGVVAPSKTPGAVDLHNAHFPPLEGLKPFNLAQVTVAIMNNPAMRKQMADPGK
ncbi:helix-turn-helix transcriptional regulator [Methylobacterium sp. W2]|uniref:helix-turn-helix domain-containing protein n=1 Tax=Methylobacterium sp. W2 TaxID=2598107 RepID=UPI001D0BF541|nr:helix-turn-helix transcriptional regulator [Methylobacterium sp. W2]MCC0808562.1 helix-turn-helix transcriptional regulator [Methylobacterium sp. W2]